MKYRVIEVTRTHASFGVKRGDVAELYGKDASGGIVLTNPGSWAVRSVYFASCRVEPYNPPPEDPDSPPDSWYEARDFQLTEGT